MNKPNELDAVIAERRRILQILYRADVQLTGPAALAINRGQDARTFCPERAAGEAEALEAATASAEPATAAGAGARPWSEITTAYNAQRRTSIATPDEESAS